jgi:glycosyltransferase involved in cell wall biosynthesis
MHALRSLARELGVAPRVTVTTAPREELAEMYADADVFLFPSEWAEPFGLTPLEAMACGTPVVGTALGGTAEFMVDGFNALVVPPGDPRAIADQVRALESDGALRTRLVEGGLRTVRGLTTDALADTFEAWYVAAARRFADGVPAARHTLPVEGRRR